MTTSRDASTTISRIWAECYGWAGQTHAVWDIGAIYGLGDSDAEAIADAIEHCPDLDVDMCSVGEISVK